MHTLIQGIIFGVLSAGMYALMASGQTLIFGIMKVVNLAQGAMVILGAYLSFQLFTSFGIDPFVSIPITTVVMFGVGVATEVFFLRPLRKEERAELSLLVTFAVALLLEGLMVFFWSTNMRSINNSYVNASWSIAGYQIPVVRVWAFVLSAVALGLLFWLLNRTKFGRAVRASVQNPESATLLGVRSETISALGFGLGAATAASAGAMYAMLYPSFNAGSHYDLISLLLSIVLLGGLGSIGGAIVGALVISLAESIVAVYDPVWAPMSFFVVLLLVLLLRPRGLFGTAARGAI